jgi:hypothetical protein
VIFGRHRESVTLLNQSDLTEQLVDRAVGDVHPGKASDALRLLAQMAHRCLTAIAGKEMGLELARRLDVELAIGVAAQRQQAAPHSAISR